MRAKKTKCSHDGKADHPSAVDWPSSCPPPSLPVPEAADPHQRPDSGHPPLQRKPAEAVRSGRSADFLAAGLVVDLAEWAEESGWNGAQDGVPAAPIRHSAHSALFRRYSARAGDEAGRRRTTLPMVAQYRNRLPSLGHFPRHSLCQKASLFLRVHA